MRALGLHAAGTLALFCLGISLSFVASALATTTTEVCCAPVVKASGDADGEALVRLDNDATNGPLPTPGEEVREGEKLSRRVSVLMSMLVLAASSFFGSGLVLVVSNPSLKGVVSHLLVVLPGGSSAAVGGRASLLGVFLL